MRYSDFPEHKIKVWRGHKTWQASCLCHWRSTNRRSYDSAAKAGREHRQEMKNEQKDKT